MKDCISNKMRLMTILIISVSVCSLTGLSKEITNLQQTIDKALTGDPSSQSDLVDYYYNTTKNYSEAIKWSNMLTSNDNAEEHNIEYAYRILGYCAYDGCGMDKSIEKAITFMKRGVEYKGGSCALFLGKLYASEIKDSIESIKWYKKSAELGNKKAAYFLGSLYEKGYYTDSNHSRKYYPNVSKDISKAAEYYEMYIADMGYRSGVPENSRLLYKLGYWYYVGECNLGKDYTKAFQLFNSALNCNERSRGSYKLSVEEYGDALWYISVCYRFGRGVEKDELMARRYVKKAAENGNKNAISLVEK